MRLLLDQNISHRLIKEVDKIFPGSQQVRALGLENTSDRAIWEYARKNNFTIVTFDADFYDLSILLGFPPKIVWIRTNDQQG